jgi:hypothetical protein
MSPSPLGYVFAIGFTSIGLLKFGLGIGNAFFAGVIPRRNSQITHRIIKERNGPGRKGKAFLLPLKKGGWEGFKKVFLKS